MTKIRICHICNGFPPTVGGTETHNYSIVKYLADKGYAVDVIVVRQSRKLLLRTNYDHDTIKTLSSPSYTLPELPGVTIHNLSPAPMRLYYDLARKVKELEKDGPIDVLDVHSYLFALPFSKRRKMILSLHFYEMSCPRSDWPLPCEKASLAKCRKCCGALRYLYWRATRDLAARKLSRYMVKYEYLGRKLIETGVGQEKVVVIPHWIDVDAISPQAVEHDSKKTSGNAGGGVVSFSFVGRLADVKNPLLALEAFRMVAGAAKQNVHLTLIGGGEMEEKVRQFCADNGIADKVTLLGRMPHEQLLKQLPLFDIHLITSNWDNYNWALLELMASGRPVVATNVGGTADILEDGYNGLLAEPNADSLASRIMQLLENPGLGQQLADNALKTVEQRHGMETLQKYEALIKELSG